MKKSTQQMVIEVNGNKFQFLNGFLCFRFLAKKQEIVKINQVEKRLNEINKRFSSNDGTFPDIEFFSDFIVSGIEAANVINKKSIEIPSSEEVTNDLENVLTSFSEAMSKVPEKPEKSVRKKGK